MKDMRHDYRDSPDEHRGPVPVAWFWVTLGCLVFWLVVGHFAGCL